MRLNLDPTWAVCGREPRYRKFINEASALYNDESSMCRDPAYNTYALFTVKVTSGLSGSLDAVCVAMLC